jgi:RHS repeat-associated protein
LEIGTDTWLRNRVYQPGSRAFLQPDPLPALPGSPTAANPYHYAANNTITLSDPLGLHPLSERELKAYRDGLDRDWGDHITSAGKWLATDGLNAVKDVAKYAWDHPGEVGTAIGVAALAAGTGPLAIGLGVASVGFGVRSASRTSPREDPLGFVLDLGGVVPGVGGVVKGSKSLLAAGKATRLAGRARTAADAADDAVRSGAIKAGGYNPNAVKASRLQGVSEQEASKAHRLEQQGRRADQFGIGMGGVSAARTHVPKFGIDLPPLTAPR